MGDIVINETEAICDDQLGDEIFAHLAKHTTYEFWDNIKSCKEIYAVRSDFCNTFVEVFFLHIYGVKEIPEKYQSIRMTKYTEVCCSSCSAPVEVATVNFTDMDVSEENSNLNITIIDL